VQTAVVEQAMAALGKKLGQFLLRSKSLEVAEILYLIVTDGLVSVITSNATTDYRIKCHHVRYT
jgi:hypothetical protein